MICADAVFQIDTIGEEALLLLSWILAEHSNQTIEQPFLFKQLSKLLSWATRPWRGSDPIPHSGLRTPHSHHRLAPSRNKNSPPAHCVRREEYRPDWHDCARAAQTF